MAINISGNNLLDEQSSQAVHGPVEIALCIVLLSLGLAGNVMLLVAQWRDPLRCFGTTCSCFIQNMAIADTFTLHVYCCFFFISVKTNSPFYIGSKHMEYLKPFVVFSSVVTNFCIVCLAVDRFMSVAKPFLYKIYFTEGRGRISFAIICIFGLVCVGIDHCISCLKPEIYFSVFAVETAVFIPCLAVLFSLYFAGFVSMKQQQRRFKRAHMAEAARNAFTIKLSNERHFLVTMSVMSFTTVILWVPVFALIISLGIKSRTGIELSDLFVAAVPYLATMHASIKPFIYILRLLKYRKTFYVLYCCICAGWNYCIPLWYIGPFKFVVSCRCRLKHVQARSEVV